MVDVAHTRKKKKKKEKKKERSVLFMGNGQNFMVKENILNKFGSV